MKCNRREILVDPDPNNIKEIKKKKILSLKVEKHIMVSKISIQQRNESQKRNMDKMKTLITKFWIVSKKKAKTKNLMIIETDKTKT